VGLLLTSDEEGDARDGVRRVVEIFARRNQQVDHCIVGEPSSKDKLGDVVRIGRRGSLHGHLTVRGVQGHVAFPQLVLNPIHALAPALAELAARAWDRGDRHFPPTSFQCSNVHAGTGALNVVPGELKLDFNFRFGPASGPEGLMQAVGAVLVKHRLDYRIAWVLSGAPYYTPPGSLLEAAKRAIRAECGLVPEANTGGGTSDGRFVATLGGQVIELGPVNATIHKIDEHVAIADLDKLPQLYRRMLEALH
jgi:succinyl-diaminopimelate desuccinylase